MDVKARREVEERKRAEVETMKTLRSKQVESKVVAASRLLKADVLKTNRVRLQTEFESAVAAHLADSGAEQKDKKALKTSQPGPTEVTVAVSARNTLNVCNDSKNVDAETDRSCQSAAASTSISGSRSSSDIGNSTQSGCCSSPSVTSSSRVAIAAVDLTATAPSPATVTRTSTVQGTKTARNVFENKRNRIQSSLSSIKRGKSAKRTKVNVPPKLKSNLSMNQEKDIHRSGEDKAVEKENRARSSSSSSSSSTSSQIDCCNNASDEVHRLVQEENKLQLKGAIESGTESKSKLQLEGNLIERRI